MEQQQKIQTTIALVGQPNVGKSALMHHLTGLKTVVSNYPGTTVDILEGRFHIGQEEYRIIDTPGTYTLHSDTKEQKVTHEIISEAPIDLIINVVDAANLGRNLYLTLQLLDFEIPMIVALNQIDRARELGISVDAEKLSGYLGVPVIPVSAVKGEGMAELKRAITAGGSPGKPLLFSHRVETIIGALSSEINRQVSDIKKVTSHPVRTLAVHLLEHDKLDEDILAEYPDLEPVVEDLQHKMGRPLPQCSNCFRDCGHCPASEQRHPILLTCLERTEKARQIELGVVKHEPHRQNTLSESLEHIIDQPVTGIPIFLVILYLSFKLVVLAIEVSEEGISLLFQYLGAILSPWFALPSSPLIRLLWHSFQEGVIIPFSIVMPAMLSVYTLIALFEDTGLLPRIAVILDRLTRVFRLPGQSIIPFLLGFGCRAPAVLASRILTSDAERFIVITLVSIIVPCAASLGIITAVVTNFQASAAVIVVTMLTAFFGLSILMSRMLKDAVQDLVLEVPPLRLPVVKDVLSKTWGRVKDFFTHVLPLMLIASIIIRVLLDLGVFQLLEQSTPVTRLLFGIRGEVFAGLLTTVVQRYLAPLVLLNLPLDAREATIACAMIALSFPCLPVSILSYRELGGRNFLKIMGIAGALPVAVGLILNLLLPH